MSAFGEQYKDEIAESIINYIKDKKENYPNILISELVEEVLDAVSYGLKDAIWDIELTNKP